MIARIPAAGLADYEQYVAFVLPLIAQNGGVLEHRLASADSTLEVFVISFPSAAAFEALQSDAHMDAAGPLLYRSGATVEIVA